MGFNQKDCFEKALFRDQNFAEAWDNLAAIGGGTIDGTTYDADACTRKANECRAAQDKSEIDSDVATVLRYQQMSWLFLVACCGATFAVSRSRRCASSVRAKPLLLA